MRFIICFIILISLGKSQEINFYNELKFGPHAIAFEQFDVIDYSRTYRNKTRSFRLSAWYPVKNSGQSVQMRDYIRAERTAIDFDTPVTDQSMIEYLRSEYGDRSDEQIKLFLDFKVKAASNGTILMKNLPLIIYSVAYNGGGMENFAVCEFLASHGFVVVAVPSFSFDRPLMDSELIGLQTKVNDLQFALAESIKRFSTNDKSVGTIGFSNGGWADVVFGMLDSRVNTIVSIEGSIAFRDDHYLYDYRKLFEPFSNFSFLNGSLLEIRRTAYYGTDAISPNEYTLTGHVPYTDSYYLGLKNMQHGSFMSITLIYDQITGISSDDATIRTKQLTVMCNHIRQFLEAKLKNDPDAENQLKAPVKSQSDDFRLSHYPAKKMIAIGEDYYNLLRSGKIDDAKQILLQSLADDSLAIPFSYRSIFNVAFQDFYLNQRYQDAWRLVNEIILYVYPNDRRSLTLAGDVAVQMNRIEDAKKYYRQALTIEPDHQRTRSSLDKLLR
ncbi:MAG: hypothetical protein KDD94_06030 [Calditrichaeota bacterium]|nr:hypothetical protein [Calditrichota bacterium]